MKKIFTCTAMVSLLGLSCAASAEQIHGFDFVKQEGLLVHDNWILIGDEKRFDMISADESRPNSFFHLLTAFRDQTVWKDYRSIRIGYEFNCETGMARQYSYDAFKDYFAKGTPEPKKVNAKWAKHADGTMVAEVIKMSCRK